jgi:hypothetical protein
MWKKFLVLRDWTPAFTVVVNTSQFRKACHSGAGRNPEIFMFF